MKTYYFIIFFLGCLVSCSESTDDKVIAEAFGQKLFASDIEPLFTQKVSKEDSVFIVKEFINSWVKTQIILQESSSILSAKELDKSKELEKYRNDLLVYETLNKLAVQRIDTNFDRSELLKYYVNNIDEFELSENIIKIVFFKIPNSFEDLDDLWTDFQRDDADAYDELTGMAKQGGNYVTDSSSWVYFNDILKEIPINTYNQEHFLSNNKFISIKEGPFTYFVKIHDFRMKSGTSPFEMEQNRIQKMLTVKKQQETLKVIETELIQKAYSNNNIIIH